MRLHDIAFYVALFFILGVGAASLEFNIWLFLILSVISGFTLPILLSKSTIVSLLNKFFVAVFVFISFLGFFYYHFYFAFQSESIVFNKEIVFQGEVVREPTHGLKTEEVDVRLRSPYEGEARIYAQPTRNLHYGDLLEIKGEIMKSPTGRLNIVSFPEVSIVSRNNGNLIKTKLFQLKEKLIANLNAVLAPQQAALMSGILLGERAEFTPEFKKQLNRSGTTHIVALSGYNISIIGLTLMGILGLFFRKRWAFYLSLFVIPLFVIMTGGEASVIRAGIMGMIVLLAQKQSRLYSFRNAVTITALVMLILNPKLLASDVGFQLSFAALLGIVYLFPYLEKQLGWQDKEGSVFELKKTGLQTFSAQVAVAPILLTTFGYFSPTALMANILILTFIPLTMFFGFLTAILGFVSYELSLVMGLFTNFILSYEILVIKFFALSWL